MNYMLKLKTKNEWDERRYEIAKAALSGLVVNECPGHYESIAKQAVLYADALIATLKGETE